MLSRFRAMSRHGGAKAFVLVAVLLATVFSMGVGIGASFVHSNANAANANSPKALSGSVSTRVAAHGTIDLSKAPKLTGNSAQKTVPLRTNFALPAAARAKVVGASHTVPSAVTEAKAPASLSSNFVGGGVAPMLGAHADGLNSTQAGGWHIPDTAIGVGGAGAAVNQYVVEGVNDAIAIYNTNLGLVAGPYSTDTVFGSVKIAGDFFNDPQITYDADRVHWVIVYLELTGSTTGSGVAHGYIDIAISKGIYPTGVPSNYNVFRFDVNLNNNSEFCDYPTLGMEYWNIYVSCATFGFDGSFLGNRVFIFNKTDLINNSGAPHWGWFYNIPTSLSCGSGCLNPAYRLAPATEDGVPNAEYVVATDAGYGVSSSNATITAITNPNALAGGSLPTATYLTSTLAAAYSDPIDAVQPGAAVGVDPGISIKLGIGIKQFMYKGGSLWFSFTTAINWSADNATRDAVYWTEVQPTLSTLSSHNPQQIAGWTNRQQEYVGIIGAYSFTPSIQPDDEGDAALIFNYSSSTVWPSIRYSGRKGDDTLNTMGEDYGWYFAVSGVHSNDSGRWGDYSTCALNVHPTSRGYAFCAGEYGGVHTDIGSTGWDTYMLVLRMN